MACVSTKRGPNFTLHEIEKLIQLVKTHWNVITNKGTDSITNASKIDAWKEIEREFNKDETCNIYRPHYVLRTKFDNLKRLRKKNPNTRLNKSSESTDSVNDAEEGTLDILKSAIAAAKIRQNNNKISDLNINDSFSEGIEGIYSENQKTDSLTTGVSAFSQEADHQYFLQEVDDYENLADGENEEFEWRRVMSHERMTSEPQDCCITQSSEESFSKKRKLDESALLTKKSNAVEFEELRKRAFLEKHNVTLRLLKEEAEQRMKHESIMNELREEEVRLRIQFMKEKHEAELNLMKANSNRDNK